MNKYSLYLDLGKHKDAVNGKWKWVLSCTIYKEIGGNRYGRGLHLWLFGIQLAEPEIDSSWLENNEGREYLRDKEAGVNNA